MMRRFFGVLSLAQVAVAVALGLWSIAAAAPHVAAGYAALLVVAPLAITWAYCAKCPCRRHGCAHLAPGLLARLWRREPGPYRPWELAVVFVLAGSICLGPLPWLVGRWLLLAAYVVLVATAVVEIRLVVCRGCGNDRCPLRR